MASKQNVREYPIHTIRENLRQSSLRQAALRSRSVGRLTSCDAQPCLEHRAEIGVEYAVINQLLYVQQCRGALERCIAAGAVRLRYKWQDGHVTDTYKERHLIEAPFSSSGKTALKPRLNVKTKERENISLGRQAFRQAEGSRR